MNIYVGNLSQDVTEDELREIFESFGQVESVNIIKDKYTGQSRGFGFVQMPSKNEALAALEEANGKDIKGRAIKVNEARSKPNRRNDRRGGFGSGRGRGSGRGGGYGSGRGGGSSHRRGRRQ
ncbi:MAG TPA: RNA-binding protein [Planctomycetes bacterium]|nr:RNA-binding protein [Planctomycetota bacterium]